MQPISATTIKLNNGVTMPQYGLGVWQCTDGEAEASVRAALQCGYRHIDTAAIYGNEEGCGRGIKDSGVPREEIFVTTKLWNTDQGFESTLKAFETSRKKLGLEYIDLYLIHFPRCDAIIAKNGKEYLDSWRAMEQLYAEKKVRAIGVSNFIEHHIDDVLAMCKVPPAVLQTELHPLNSIKPLRDFCAGKHIAITAYSPLNQGRDLKNPTLEAIAKKHGKSTAQVILRWDIQLGIVTIPKSTHEKRIRENADIFDFELSPEEMEQINGMNKNRRYNFDPEDPDAPKE